MQAGTADELLVRQLVEGKQAALGALYDRHAATVFGVALRLSGDRGIAEEVVQDTFLALWNRAGLYDPSLGSLAGWLLTIARNRSLDRVRAAGRRPAAAPFSALVGEHADDASMLEWLVAAGDVVTAAAPEPEPETALAASETRAAVVAALASLEGAERRVILLAYRDGLSQSEIAAHLGWPLGTVKTRTRRALQRLRDVLEGAPAGDVDRVASA